MGSVGGRERDAGEATEVDSDARGYSRKSARGAVTAADGEEGDGVGVGVLDLEVRWVNDGNWRYEELGSQWPAHLLPMRPLQSYQGLA